MFKSIATRARRRHSVVLGQFISLVCAVLIAVGSVSLALLIGARANWPPQATVLLFLAATALGLVGVQAGLDQAAWFGQRGRDLRAARVWSALRVGREPSKPFCLYLRPFSSTGEVTETTVDVSLIAPSTGGAPAFQPLPREIELEAEIESQLKPIGALIALGDPLEHLGAGRIRASDRDWKEVIRRLAYAAKLVVLLPSSRPGTLWETGFLCDSGVLEKTLIVDPPNTSGDADDFRHAEEWETIRQAFAARGYDLPEDDPNGLLVSFDGPERSAKVTPLNLDDGSTVKRVAKQIVRAGQGR